MTKTSATSLPLASPTLPVETSGEVIDLRSFFQVEAFESGALIYRPNDAAERAFLVRSGRVRLLRLPGSAPRPAAPHITSCSLHALLRPGDFFGELMRPADAVYDEYAVASGDTEVWSIGNRDLEALVEARPALALELLRSLDEGRRQLRRRINALTFKEVPARLAEAVLTLGETHGERCPHGGEVDLRGITQQDLADLVGASRSFVSTLINEMKRDGLLGNVGRTLCIRNGKGLRKLASRDRV